MFTKWAGRMTGVDYLGGACLLVVFLRTALLPFEESWPWESEAWELAYDIALAFLTGWVLHLLVVVRPRRRDQHAMYEVLGPKIQALGGVGRSMAHTLAKEIPLTLPDPEGGPSLAEWESICSGLKFQDPMVHFYVLQPGGIASHGTVLQFLLSEIERADRFVKAIQEAAPYLDAGLNALVHREQAAALRALLDSPGLLLRSTLEHQSKTFADYDAIGREISAYYEAQVRPHTSNRLPHI